MPDFLLELRSEEIPARMQAKAREDLADLFTDQLAAAGLAASIETHATPRRLTLIARGLSDATERQSEERRGPRADAPAQALEGFLKSTGLTRDQLEERTDKKGTFLYAVIQKPGRATIDVLAEAIPAIVRGFPWPKSMRWSAASASTESPRWVRPLTGIVALLGERIVPCEIAGIVSGAATLGHRFHHPGIITIGSADDYAAKLRACHVMLDGKERAQVIEDGARACAAAAGLTLVHDAGLIAENAGLTEWPVPLLGRFDPAFLDVPREVIQLTMRTNQKYFSCVYPPLPSQGRGTAEGGGGAEPSGSDDAQHRWTTAEGGREAAGGADGTLAPAFVCTANIEASDGGAAIVAGNERVLSARLADAKFFWEADLRVPLEEQAKKLAGIVFHEKLGTVADKVDRVAKLARWLVEEGIVGANVAPAEAGASGREGTEADPTHEKPAANPPEMPASAGMTRSDLANLAERAARLCKADLVTQMVGEFPELQGTIGAHLARAQGEDPQVADAIRDHYKPVGQGDEVPIAPVTVAVSLADKLDSVFCFLSIEQGPTGSRDPFAVRRSMVSSLSLIEANQLRLSLNDAFWRWVSFALNIMQAGFENSAFSSQQVEQRNLQLKELFDMITKGHFRAISAELLTLKIESAANIPLQEWFDTLNADRSGNFPRFRSTVLQFAGDRLKVQQREAGVRHDLIDAVFALGGEDDLVRLLARVRALQAFVETPEGRDLLAGYKRAANILKKEGYTSPVRLERSRETLPSEAEAPKERVSTAAKPQLVLSEVEGLDTNAEEKLSYTPDPVEQSLIAALDSAEPRARAAVEEENFGGAMAALASLRGPVDAFFETVTVNDPDPAKREARLALLARMRDAVHTVADFSRIEG